jgi:hypothetical protein
MKQFVVPQVSYLDEIPDADPQTLVPQVRGYLSVEMGIVADEVSIALLARCIAVYRYKGHSGSDGDKFSGWVVCGNIPFLDFNDDEIKTPIEALALYVWFLSLWMRKKGKVDGESVPQFKVPPDWAPLTYEYGSANSYEKWRMGAVTNYVEWHLIPANEAHVVHPEIRDRCIRRGWIQRKPAAQAEPKGRDS